MLNARKMTVLALALLCFAGSARVAHGSIWGTISDLVGEGGPGTKHLIIFNETGRKIRLDISGHGHVYLDANQDFWTTQYQKSYYVKMFVWNSNTKRWVRKAVGTFGAGARVSVYKRSANEFYMRAFYPR